MLSKLKRFIKRNKKLIIWIIFFILVMISLLVLYKILFYSDDEKAIYGVRITDIDEYKLEKKDVTSLEKKASELEKINSVKITIKGRLIKYLIDVDSSLTNDEIKNKINEMANQIDDDTKSYYDVTFYVSRKTEDSVTYPIIGYKHKNKENITFTEV